MSNIEFKKGKIYVEGVETIDPELIGFAVLDFVDQHEDQNILLSAEPEKMFNPFL